MTAEPFALRLEVVGRIDRCEVEGCRRTRIRFAWGDRRGWLCGAGHSSIAPDSLVGWFLSTTRVRIDRFVPPGTVYLGTEGGRWVKGEGFVPRET